VRMTTPSGLGPTDRQWAAAEHRVEGP